MFEFHGEVIEVPSTLDVGLSVTRPVLAPGGDIDVRATLDLLADEPPGPWMATIAAHIGALAEQAVTADERVDLVVLFERCEAWMSAQKQRALAALSRQAEGADRKNPSARYEDLVLEAALALSWSESMTHDRMSVARELDERLPATWQALAEGRLNFAKAREIAKGAEKLADDDHAAELERRVLAEVDDLIQNEVRKRVEWHVTALDPEGAEERRQGARGRRQVRRSPGEDSSAHLSVFGPTEAMAAIYAGLTDGAQQLKATGQVDTIDQGRFDTLYSWAIRHFDEGLLPDRSPVPVAATVIVKASTAAHQDDDPAEIAGFGPITAQAARDLLAGKPPAPGPFEKRDGRFVEDAVPRDEELLPTYLRTRDDEPPPDVEDLPPDDWQWEPPPEQSSAPRVDPFTVAWRVLKVDPATGWAVPPPGVRMNYGNERRFATPRQARYVRDRDRSCSIPICTKSGRQVEIDHRKEAARGGATDVSNLGPGCPHHNRTTRNRSSWTIEPNEDETATLITPQGRRYVIKPHDYLA